MIPPPDWTLVDPLLGLALREDIGPGDVTTLALLDGDVPASGRYVARAAGVMAGFPVLERLFARMAEQYRDGPLAGAARVALRAALPEGAAFAAGETLLTVAGPSAAVLAGERVSLNLLQRMCAVAARTRELAALVVGTRARIYDTRKTLPGHRQLDKDAVRAGGGCNHRIGLYDMVLVKDNHLALFGSPSAAVRRARERADVPVMVEADTFEQFLDALAAEPDFILLDNMAPEALARAVAAADELCAARGWRRPELEASGGVTATTVAAIARAGVDRISVGALTHGAASLDIGLDFGTSAEQ